MRFIRKFVIGLSGIIISYSCPFAGSYPYAETYNLPVQDSSLLKSIQLFKQEHPDYLVPKTVGLGDGKSGLWYNIYFYYPDKNQIVHTWIRSGYTGETTFALIGVNDGLKLGNWQIINRDFGNSENRRQKQLFENRILNPIKKIASIR